MASIIVRPDWRISERLVTPEKAFLNRRDFLRRASLAGAGLLSVPLTRRASADSPTSASPAKTNSVAGSVTPSKNFPAPRNGEFNPNRALTSERVASHYNNFYEFSLGKDVY